MQARITLNQSQTAYNKVYNQVLIDMEKIRKRITQEHPDFFEDDNKILLYGIQYKFKFIKIQDNYWDTMKMLQETAVSKLSTEQLQLVNQEIEKEISLEYFKSIMGLN